MALCSGRVWLCDFVTHPLFYFLCIAIRTPTTFSMQATPHKLSGNLPYEGMIAESVAWRLYEWLYRVSDLCSVGWLLRRPVPGHRGENTHCVQPEHIAKGAFNFPFKYPECIKICLFPSGHGYASKWTWLRSTIEKISLSKINHAAFVENSASRHFTLLGLYCTIDFFKLCR